MLVPGLTTNPERWLFDHAYNVMCDTRSATATRKIQKKRQEKKIKKQRAHTTKYETILISAR